MLCFPGEHRDHINDGRPRRVFARLPDLLHAPAKQNRELLSECHGCQIHLSLQALGHVQQETNLTRVYKYSRCKGQRGSDVILSYKVP